MCSEPLFIPNFEPFKIPYFHSHFLASRGPDYFLFLISICFEIAFYSLFRSVDFSTHQNSIHRN